MSFLYDTAYRLGISPWDLGKPMDELVDLIEGPSALPPGRAADLGCGAGTKSIYLARQGWDVTGVDISAQALKHARDRTAEAGVAVRYIEADILDMPLDLAERRFEFLLDFGCAHNLRNSAKSAYAKAVAGIAAPQATLYLYGFTKGPQSITREQIDNDFGPYWELVSAEPGSIRRWPDAGPVWYRMVVRDR
ncbi:class I SAM-dependent methyltransferase [Nocardia sp. NPDC055053]